MMVWDIMGQKGFTHLLQDSYFYGATGGIAVCDSTRAETLKELEDWIQSFHSVTGEIPMVFLANKCDLVDQIVIDEKTIADYVTKYNAPHFYSSAKTGQNVEEAFEALGRTLTMNIH